MCLVHVCIENLRINFDGDDGVRFSTYVNVAYVHCVNDK